jgi:hypothetical protein
MPEKNQTEAEAILFGGKLTSDVVDSVEALDVSASKNFDMFGADIDADEQDEAVQDDNGEEGESEGEEPISQVELLKQQNALLMKQLELSKVSGVPQVNEADKLALQTGQALLNMQAQNPVLYNKMNAWLQEELGGKQNTVDIGQKLNAVRSLLKGEKYKDLDVQPFENILETVEFTANNTKRENQQLIAVINSLKAQVDSLTQHHETVKKQAVQSREEKAYEELEKAQRDFGVKIKPNSEEAKDIVLLVRAGKDPRKAYMTIFGKKETDVVTSTKKPKEIKPAKVLGNPKEGTTPIRNVDALAKKMFGDSLSSKDIFVKRKI